MTLYLGRISVTKHNGSVIYIEVTETSLQKVLNQLQEEVNSFSWKHSNNQDSYWEEFPNKKEYGDMTVRKGKIFVCKNYPEIVNYFLSSEE